MVAHVWKDVRKYGDARDILANEHRVCELCGKGQELVVEHAWGRVVSRRWLPLVGRCTGRASSRRALDLGKRRA